jgi:hypothetical protein
MNDNTIREELEETARSYRRLHEEHRHSHPQGHTRRRLELRLHDLADHLERLLDSASVDEATRRGWREHLLHGAPAPERPEAPPPKHRWPPLRLHPRPRSLERAPLWRR